MNPPANNPPAQGEPVFSCQKPVCECATKGIHPRACMDAQKSAQAEIGKVVANAVRAIGSDLDIYVSGSPLTNKYQAAKEYLEASYAEEWLLLHLAPLTARLAEVERELAAAKEERDILFEQKAAVVADLTKLRGELEEAKKENKRLMDQTSAGYVFNQMKAAWVALGHAPHEYKPHKFVEAVKALQSALAQKEKDGERLRELVAELYSRAAKVDEAATRLSIMTSSVACLANPQSVDQAEFFAARSEGEGRT